MGTNELSREPWGEESDVITWPNKELLSGIKTKSFSIAGIYTWAQLLLKKHTGLRAITAPSKKQANKLSQLQIINIQWNLLTVAFFAI